MLSKFGEDQSTNWLDGKYKTVTPHYDMVRMRRIGQCDR